MAKTTKAATAVKLSKGGNFNSVFLAWVLTFLAIPTVLELVPAYFGQGNTAFNYAGETIWFEVWSSVWQSTIFFLLLTLIISFATSLILNKDASNNVSLKKISRSAFVIATIINVAICTCFIGFAYLLPLLGLQS